MTRAILFLLSCSLKNRILGRLERLRQPKYLISAMAGLAYVYFVLIHQSFINSPQIPQEPLISEESLITMAETGVACLLLVVVMFQWIFSNSRIALFNEAEIQFLFTAPISRRALIHYRIAKAQIGIAFGALISFLIFGRGRVFAHAGFLFTTLWFVYAFLYLNRIVVLLRKRRRTRQAWALGVFLCAALLTAFWVWRFLPLPPMTGERALVDLFAWLRKLAGSAPLLCLLFPFKLLIRPAFASNAAQFAWRMAPVLAVIGSFYGWILRSDSTFEESVLGPAGKEACLPLKAPRFRIGRQRGADRSQRPPFHLAPNGFAPVAIYWKNLFLAVGFHARRRLPVLAALAILSVLLLSYSGESSPVIIGSIAAALAGFLTLLGPVIFREDLRTDLKNIDLLKIYPIHGWGIVLGEILSPATVLALLEWILVALAASLLPDIGIGPWNVYDRIAVGLAAILLLPCLSLIGILVQNAAVLILPGWVQIGKEHQRGVEAMGQRLIASIATALFLVIAALPAALLFFIVSAVGYRALGSAIVPVASLLAAAVLLVEGGIVVLWLGHLFDEFDASKELD